MEQAPKSPANRIAFGVAFAATAFFTPLASGLLLPSRVMIVLSSVLAAITLVGFVARAGWYVRGRPALLYAAYGLGAGVIYWGLTRMGQELQEVTYFLTDKSPQGLEMAQYVAPEAGAVVPLFKTDLFIFLAALTVVAGLDAAYKARSKAPEGAAAPDQTGKLA